MMVMIEMQFGQSERRDMRRDVKVMGIQDIFGRDSHYFTWKKRTPDNTSLFLPRTLSPKRTLYYYNIIIIIITYIVVDYEEFHIIWIVNIYKLQLGCCVLITGLSLFQSPQIGMITICYYIYRGVHFGVTLTLNKLTY